MKTTNNRNYFDRLSDHPGVGVAAAMTALFFVAAFGNENVTAKVATLLGFGSSVIVWAVVLISNFKRD